jgi:glutathione S-transferase
MKLYYYPGACSLAADIVLREAGLPFELDAVDLASKKTAGGEDYLKVNPKGYVPALRLDDGEVLTEVAAILQYVADRKPDSGLAPAPGSMAHYQLIEWLNFISSEVHKAFGPLWNPQNPDAVKQGARDQLARRFDWLSQVMAGRPFLMGDTCTIADAYLAVVVNWCNLHAIDLGRWPVLRDHLARVFARPAAQAALKAEGLVK